MWLINMGPWGLCHTKNSTVIRINLNLGFLIGTVLVLSSGQFCNCIIFILADCNLTWGGKCVIGGFCIARGSHPLTYLNSYMGQLTVLKWRGNWQSSTPSGLLRILTSLQRSSDYSDPVLQTALAMFIVWTIENICISINLFLKMLKCIYFNVPRNKLFYISYATSTSYCMSVDFSKETTCDCHIFWLQAFYFEATGTLIHTEWDTDSITNIHTC